MTRRCLPRDVTVGRRPRGRPLLSSLLLLSVCLLFLGGGTHRATHLGWPSLFSVAGYTLQPTPAADKLEASFPSRAGDASVVGVPSGYDIPSEPIRALVVTTNSALVARVSAAFEAVNPQFQMKMTIGLKNAEIKSAFLAGDKYDFAVVVQTPAAADYLPMPSLQYYPLQANAIVFAVGSGVHNGRTVALTGEVICRIHRGDITTWQHPDIIATNPGLTLPNQNITILLLQDGSATHSAVSSYCNKIDPIFESMIPAQYKPNYPATLRSKYYINLDQVSSAVSDEPYSLCMTSQTMANTFKLRVGAMVNAEGQAILPTPNAMALTLFELGTNGYPPNSNAFDLTRTSTPQAWPILSMSYLYVSGDGAVSTCAKKRLLLKFLRFFYEAEVVEAVAASLYTTSFPAVFVSQLRILERLESELTCRGESLTSGTEARGTVAINALGEQTLSLFASFYRAVDTAFTFGIDVMPEELAVHRLALGENSMALVCTHTITPTAVRFMEQGLVNLVPAFMAAVVPIFRLPARLLSFAALASTKELNLPELYPLALDVDTATLLFIGEIASWLDPRLTALNPQLVPWFEASLAPTALHLLIAGSAADETHRAAKLLFQALASSSTAAAAEHLWAFLPPASQSGPQSNPFVAVMSRAPSQSRANWTLIDVESRLATKLLTLSGGGVSYRLMQEIADPTVEFQFVEAIASAHGDDSLLTTTSTTSRSLIRSHVESLRVCANIFSTPPNLDADDTRLLLQRFGTPGDQLAWLLEQGQPKGCWPLSTTLAFAAKLSYSSLVSPTACTRGLHALEFINYVQSTPVLSPSALSLGMVRLADFDLVRQVSSRILQSATCDDATLLVILPVYWTVPSAAVAFAQAVAVIALVVVLGSLVTVVYFRRKVVIRSSSTPFLCVILVGMGLLSGALLAWGAEASKQNCASFLWLANLGFMTLFCPLFAKTWRVWRIFSQSNLRIVKINNRKLLLGTAMVLLADMVLVAVWQGVAPLVPVQYDRIIDGHQHVFTHCSVQSSGAGLVFVGLVATEKGLLLLFGAVMAFSTRNVKGTFNESSAISWSIYNTLLTLIIGVVIIVFVGAVEDTLVILVLALLLWIVCTSWALIFLPKFQMLFHSEEKMIEMSRSEIAHEKTSGFSFASIAMMTAGQVKAYYQALKSQVNKAERVLKLPLTSWGGTGSTGFLEESGGAPAGGLGRPRRRQVAIDVSDDTEQQDTCSLLADRLPLPRDEEAARERTVLAGSTQRPSVLGIQKSGKQATTAPSAYSPTPQSVPPPVYRFPSQSSSTIQQQQQQQHRMVTFAAHASASTVASLQAGQTHSRHVSLSASASPAAAHPTSPASSPNPLPNGTPAATATASTAPAVATSSPSSLSCSSPPVPPSADLPPPRAADAASACDVSVMSIKVDAPGAACQSRLRQRQSSADAPGVKAPSLPSTARAAPLLHLPGTPNSTES